MTKRLHQVTLHRSPIGGVEAMELASNHSFPRHTHDEYGIGVVLSGAQRSWSGIGHVESLPGDVITVNPGELHDGTPINGTIRGWRIIYFDPQVLKQSMSETTREIEFVSPSLRDPLLSRHVNLLFNKLTGGAERLSVDETLTEVLKRLVSADFPAFNESGRFTPPVVKARARIEEDPSSPTTLAELAALSGVSRYQIVRAFARELGTTPHAYLVQCRVRLVRQLLLNAETLADIAQRAGFADQSHMTRAFVRQFGITPGRYLAAHQSRRAARLQFPSRRDVRFLSKLQ
jgi:AraC-like DNA-binding protein